MVWSRTLGKVFLVSLSSRFNLCCSPRRAQLQRGALLQWGCRPGLRTAQSRGSARHEGSAGRSWEGDESRDLWWAQLLHLYSSDSRSSASVPRRPMAGTWWTELSQVPSQLPATTDHAVSKPIYEQKGTLVSPPHGLAGREGSIPRWATLEPVPSLVMAKKEQARYPSWHTAGIGRQWTCTFFFFLQHVSYPSLFFFSDLSKNKRNGKAFSKISFSNDSPSATKSKQVACAWKV